MSIKLSAVEEPKPAAKATERMRAAFVLVLGGILAVLRGVFLPHLAAATALAALSGYTLYHICLAPWHLPSWLLVAAALFLMGIYGALGFAYALLLSLVFSIRAAAGHVEDLLLEVFSNVKDKVRAKIDSMDEGVAKQQAKVILDNSVREVFAPLKAFRFQSGAQAVSVVFLSVLTFVTRAVFLARLAKLGEATINFSAVFASRATLIGALFLNLRWLAALVLWLLYALGIMILLFNIWLIW